MVLETLMPTPADKLWESFSEGLFLGTGELAGREKERIQETRRLLADWTERDLP